MFSKLCLILTFVQTTIGQGTGLFEYVNNTRNYCVQPFSPIVNTIKLAKEYGIDIFRDDSRDNYLLGGYSSHTKNIALYNFPELEYFDKLHEITLKHELIHAIQHCKGGRERFVPLIDFMSLILCVFEKNIYKVPSYAKWFPFNLFKIGRRCKIYKIYHSK